MNYLSKQTFNRLMTSQYRSQTTTRLSLLSRSLAFTSNPTAKHFSDEIKKAQEASD